MIKDNIKNSKLYYNLSENIQKGLKWLEETDLINIKNGKYEIDDNKVFANVQEYKTKQNAKYEAHHKYIDIQYIVKGEELIGVTTHENCIITDKYNSETDLEFMDININDEYITLKEQEFLILYPHDVHKPSINPYFGQNNVKKVVVKALIN